MRVLNRIDQRFDTLMHDQSFIEAHRSSSADFTRKCFLSFGRIVGLILQKMTRSLQVEANLLGEVLGEEPVTKQALSAARYKVKSTVFQEMHEAAKEIYFTEGDKRLWKGYRVFGGDGSTLQLPKRGDIPDVFGDHFKRTALARVMQYVELTSDIVAAASIQPYKTSEVAMSKEMLPKLVEQFKGWGQPQQIYVYDRGFPSHALAQKHIDLGVDYLFRVQKTFSNEILAYVNEKQEAEFYSTVKRGPIHYTARVIIRFLESGEPLVLITSLTDRNKFTTEELLDLYMMRWRSEEAYKFQKILLQMDNVHCRSAEGVKQEFYATVALAFSTCVRFLEQDDLLKQLERAKPGTKVNRSVVFASMKSHYLRCLLRLDSFEEYERRFSRLCQKHRCKDRPNRSYPRLSVDTRKTRHCHRRHA